MTTDSKRTDTQQDMVKAASKEVERAEKTHEKLLAREKRALSQLEAAKARAKGSNLKRLSNAALATRHRASDVAKERVEAAAKLREARKILREQEQIAREAERKERAKERAIAAFAKKWEREYDLEMQRKKKNIQLRKQEFHRD